MKFNDPKQVKLFVKSMGKLLRVTAAFENVDEANKHCEAHKDDGVVAEIGETILLANLYDTGLKSC